MPIGIRSSRRDGVMRLWTMAFIVFLLKGRGKAEKTGVYGGLCGVISEDFGGIRAIPNFLVSNFG